MTVGLSLSLIKDVPTNKTFLFVAFGKEEQGLIGVACDGAGDR